MLQALVNQEAKKPKTKRNDIQGNKLNKNQDCNSQFHGKLSSCSAITGLEWFTPNLNS